MMAIFDATVCLGFVCVLAVWRVTVICAACGCCGWCLVWVRG